MRGDGSLIRRVVMAGALVALWTAPLAAQEPSAGVREVIDRLFEGMRRGDADQAGSAFAAGARFAILPEAGEVSVE